MLSWLRSVLRSNIEKDNYEDIYIYMQITILKFVVPRVLLTSLARQ